MTTYFQSIRNYLGPDLTGLLKTAVLFRGTLFTIAVISNMNLPSYDTSTSLLYPKEPLNPGCQTLSLIASTWDRWDAVHFAGIAQHGYVHEHNHAFYPLLPLLGRFLSPLSRALLPSSCSERTCLLLSFITLSHASFLLSVCAMLALSSRVLAPSSSSSSLARTATLLFIFQPSLPFTLAPYTEAVFALAALGGMLAVELRRPFLGAAAFAIAAALRSNGVVLVGYLGWHALRQMATAIRRYRRAHGQQDTARMQWTDAMLQLLAEDERGREGGASSGRRERERGGCGRGEVAWELGAILLSLLLQTMIACAGHLLFSAYGWLLYCDPQRLHALLLHLHLPGVTRELWAEARSRGGVPAAEAFCASPGLILGSSLYAYVQDRYWGNGLLRYYELKQLPNFLLATPILLLAFFSAWQHARALLLLLAASPSSSSSSTRKRRSVRGDHSASSPTEAAFALTALPYTLHAVFLAAVALLLLNVQVSTRLLAACPSLYWSSAVMLRRAGRRASPQSLAAGRGASPRPHAPATATQAPPTSHTPRRRRSRSSGGGGGTREAEEGGREREVGREREGGSGAEWWARRGLVAFSLAYALLGSLLFSTFLPWT